MSVILSLTKSQTELLINILEHADVPDNQKDLIAIIEKVKREPKVVTPIITGTGGVTMSASGVGSDSN